MAKKEKSVLEAAEAASRIPNGTGTKDAGLEKVTIAPLRMQIMTLPFKGVEPFMQLRFSQKSMAKMKATQEAGGQSKSKKNRDPRDFKDDYQQAMYRLPDDGYGIPASAFRSAAVSVCRLVGYKMTIAKMSIFILADGYDVKDGTPLVRLNGEPEMNIMPVRNASGVADLRARPLWREWDGKVRVRFDLDQFSSSDVVNLMCRVGMQAGLGEGRPDSRDSCGLGYGLFELLLDT